MTILKLCLIDETEADKQHDVRSYRLGDFAPHETARILERLKQRLAHREGEVYEPYLNGLIASEHQSCFIDCQETKREKSGEDSGEDSGENTGENNVPVAA